jgi:alkaline phosphatase
MLNVVKADVIIGGGHPLYAGGVDKGYVWHFIGEDLYKAFSASENHADYVFVERTAGRAGEESLAQAFAQAKSQRKKLFGLFGGPEGNLESPEPTNDGTAAVKCATIENPPLKAIVAQTLDYLTDLEDGRGFFALFEQGDIDWANHDNDYARMIGCTWDLHEAVQAAVDFVEAPGDDVNWENTLVLVTADHSNSYMRIREQLGKGRLPRQVAVQGAKSMEGYVGKFEYPGGEVTYGTGGHTNEPVMVYAKGAGAGLFEEYEGAWYPGTRLIDNTHLFQVMARALGLEVEVSAPRVPQVAAAR